MRIVEENQRLLSTARMRNYKGEETKGKYALKMLGF